MSLIQFEKAVHNIEAYIDIMYGDADFDNLCDEAQQELKSLYAQLTQLEERMESSYG